MRISRLVQHRVVLNYGVYDQFNPTQARALQTMAQLGDALVVGCLTDEGCVGMGLTSVRDFETRRRILASCRFVDRVIAVHSMAQHRIDIVNHNASIFAMGAEWHGAHDDLQDIAQVIYLAQAIEQPFYDVASRCCLKIAV